MKRKKQSKARTVRCPYCGAVAVIRPASEIYHNDRCKGKLYVCSNYPKCQSYVGIHPQTKMPLGDLADGDLRHLRIRAHRMFDRIWQTGLMPRRDAYRWMADYFAIPLSEAHIGQFGDYRCRELIRKCSSILDHEEQTI